MSKHATTAPDIIENNHTHATRYIYFEEENRTKIKTNRIYIESTFSKLNQMN